MTYDGGGGRKRGERTANEEEEDDEEEENGGRGIEAWERAYADERSWEDLQEDESGLLRPIDTKTIAHAQYRRRLLQRSTHGASRIQKGLIRYLYVVIDLSRVGNFFFIVGNYFSGGYFFLSAYSFYSFIWKEETCLR